LLDQLELTGVVLAGASTGTGVVTRYLGAFGSGRVRKAVLIGAVPPFLLETADNLDGLPRAVLDRMRDAIAADPETADQAQAWMDAWLTDFRADLPRIDVPVLLVHGQADRVTPIDATANRLPDLIADLRYEVVPDGPHDIACTHPEVVNRHLLEFAAS
jgi:non-heme chloroperoxidase